MKVRLLSVLSIAGSFPFFLSTAVTNAAEFNSSVDDGLTATFDNGIEFSSGFLLQGDTVKFDDGTTTLDDSGEFRRARIKNSLEWSDWKLRADYDFRISEGWKSTYVQYSGLKKQRITVGNHVSPFSMEAMTSSSSMPLMERSIANALNPGLLVGASYRTWRDRWSLQAGVYGDELSELDNRSLPGKSIIGRFTFAPVRSDIGTLHLGIGVERRNIDDGKTARLRARPGTRLTDRRLVDTRRIDDVDGSTSVGLELAATYQRFRIQSEMNRTTLNRNQGDLRFDSRYVLASVVLAGEPYRYSHSRGVFRAVRSDNGWGALELAARVARVDLSDGPIAGGEQIERTLGLGWTLNQKLRLMLNYSDIEVAPNRDGVDEDVSLWSLRFQLAI